MEKINEKLEKKVLEGSINFFTDNFIKPFYARFLESNDMNMDCYKIFDQELAEILTYNQPDCFEIDYFSRVGQYFYSSLHGDSIEKHKLIEYITLDKNEKPHKEFEGVHIIFEDTSTLKYELEDSYTFGCDCVYNSVFNDIFYQNILKELNNSLIIEN